MNNKCIFLGNITKKPDIKITDSGVKYVQFNVACNERGYKKQDGTEVPERTEFIPCLAWRSTAEYLEKYVGKGDKLLVEGKFRTRTYDDQNGTKRYISEIIVDSLEHMHKSSNTTPAPVEPEQGKQAEEQTQLAALSGDDLPF